MSDASRDFRVGIFVTAALLIGGAFVFVIGNRSAMFASRDEYVTHFTDVGGLRAGSPVRIAGIDVGTVEEVSLEEDGRILVRLQVRHDVSDHIRQDSVATIGSKGLLGDQLIDITVGHGARFPEEGVREIPSLEASMLASMLGNTGAEAEGMLEDAHAITTRVRATLADPQLQQDIRDMVHNLAEISRMAQEEDGTVRRLLTDPEMADEVQTAISSLSETSSELNRTVRGVRRIVSEIESGDGTVHEVIYGDEGVQLLANLAVAASEIATILRDVRTGDNNAHELLYGDEAGDLITNLTAASADIQAIIADVRAGRGTIGGLLVDPSIYEDIKRLVGNLQRNEILRSLVRYSIREDEPAPATPRPEPSE